MGFTLVRDGRTGSIYFKENPFVLELLYELSGSLEFDILIDESGFTNWILPSQDAIDKDKIELIKKSLAFWLKNSNTRYSHPPYHFFWFVFTLMGRLKHTGETAV